jgi:hypothetical protein
VKISVILDALTGTFETDIQRATSRAEKNFKKMRTSINQMAKAVAVAVAAAVTALGAMIRASAKTADEFAKLSRSTGIAVETLSGYAHAAELSGTNSEGLAKGLARLARNASDAANGLATPIRAFEFLNIEFVDAQGNLREVDELMLDVADRFSEMEDGTKKAALAQELFGRSGTQLINMLNLGRDGLSELNQEAKDFGLIFSTEAAHASEQFNDNLNRLYKTSVGFRNHLLHQLIPELEAVTNLLVNAARETGGFADAASDAADSIVESSVFIVNAFSGVNRVVDSLAQLLIILNSLGGTGGLALSSIFSDDAKTELKQRFLVIEQALDKLRDNVNKPLAGTALFEEIQREMANIRAGNLLEEIDTSGILPLIAPVIGEISLGNIEPIPEESIVLMRDAQRVFLDTRNNAQLLAIELDRLANMRSTEIFGRALLDEETYNLAVEAAKAKFAEIEEVGSSSFFNIEEAAKQASRNIQDVLAEFLFDPFENGLKGMLDGFTTMLRRMAAEAAASEILSAVFKSEGGFNDFVGNALGSIFGGARAGGGPVSANSAYLVGEEGPEMFIPRSSGMIVPNGQAAGGMSFSMTVVTQDANSFNKSRAQIENDMVGMMTRARRSA